MLSRSPLRLPLIISGALLAGAAACTDTPDDDADSVTAALEKENGGLETTDEAPLFGMDDAFRAAAVERDVAVTDELDADADVVALRTRPDLLHARVAIVWGQLPPDRDATASHDWSGTLTASRGALVVRRVIGFEEGMDRLLPRTDRRVVAFESVTRPFADGVVLEVIDDATAGADPLTITYASRGGTVLATFPLARLLAGPAAVELEGGNRIIANALRRDRDACDHGFMRGRWHSLRDGKGVFMGVVADADGAPIGHLRGIWGVRMIGEQVFFAKYIDRDGQFRGIFAGHYGDGSFRGRWMTRAGEHGRAGGHYRESRPGGAVGGGFIGRWAETSCAADLPPDAP